MMPPLISPETSALTLVVWITINKIRLAHLHRNGNKAGAPALIFFMVFWFGNIYIANIIIDLYLRDFPTKRKIAG